MDDICAAFFLCWHFPVNSIAVSERLASAIFTLSISGSDASSAMSHRVILQNSGVKKLPEQVNLNQYLLTNWPGTIFKNSSDIGGREGQRLLR